MIQLVQYTFEWDVMSNYIVPIGIVIILIFIWCSLKRILQYYYVAIYKQPLSTHVYFKLDKLTPVQRSILITKFSFYRRLSDKYQKYFEHRVAVFIKEKEFIGNQELVVTEYMKVTIAATATMLTFGFKKFRLDLIDKVILYPSTYYSKFSDAHHKGEINPKLKAIVFSWEDFEHGYDIENDNLNLGIHEFGHAIHINASRNSDMSSLIFNKGFNSLTTYLQNNETVRQNLIASKYFRTYAYTNHFEFFAVLLENFIETPVEFKSQFPELYKYIKQMLNFKFVGY